MSIPESSICWEFKTGAVPTENNLDVSDFKPIGPLAKAVRFGLKRSQLGSLRFSCYANNLEQIGLTLKDVTGSFGHQRQFVQLERVEPGSRIPLFCKTFFVPYAGPQLHPSIIRIYATGSVEEYVIHSRCDGQLGDQLWKTAVEKKMTDVEFAVRDRKFYAHKFILAARSQVFRSMFDADNREPLSISVDPDVFEQFLQFLYTGQLAKPIVGTALGRLANKYDVEALIGLCREAALRGVPVNGEEMVDLISPFTSMVENTAYAVRVPGRRSGHSCSPLSILRWEGPRILHTETFTVQVNDMQERKWLVDHAFLYNVDSKKGTTFYSCGHVMTTDVGTTVDSVEVHVQDLGSPQPATGEGEQRENDIQRVTMTPLSSLKHHQKTLQVFSTKEINFKKLSSPLKFLMRFVVCRSSLVDTLQPQLRDSSYAGQLWSAVENKQRTDIEFQVGDKVFPAHRALLAARCPKMAALVPAEHSSAPVQVDDVDPSVFEELLYFLYTGQLRVRDVPMLQLVLGAAKRFQIESLVELDKWTQFASPDEISETLIELLG